MTPTHNRDNSHHSHDANNSNAPKNVRNTSGRFKKRIGFFLAAVICVGVLTATFFYISSLAATAVPMASTTVYTENFSDIANWTDNFASGTGANRWGSVAVNATGTIPDGVRTTNSTATFVTGASTGVQRGGSGVNPAGTIVLLGAGATDNTTSLAIDLFLDFTGVNAGALSFDWASVNNSTGDRKASLRVYTSTDGTTFTELSPAALLNFTNNSPTSGSITSVSLPSSFVDEVCPVLTIWKARRQ